MRLGLPASAPPSFLPSLHSSHYPILPNLTRTYNHPKNQHSNLPGQNRLRLRPQFAPRVNIRPSLGRARGVRPGRDRSHPLHIQPIHPIPIPVEPVHPHPHFHHRRQKIVENRVYCSWGGESFCSWIFKWRWWWWWWKWPWGRFSRRPCKGHPCFEEPLCSDASSREGFVGEPFCAAAAAASGAFS